MRHTQAHQWQRTCTGAAALVWSLNPELTPSEMKELLMSTGETSLWADGRTVSGNRLDVLNALEEADPTQVLNWA